MIQLVFLEKNSLFYQRKRELHLKELFKLLLKILSRESHIEEINLMITTADIQLLSNTGKETQSTKPSNNKTGNKCPGQEIFKCNAKA